jgi:Fur family zinc uptake transcriptional regulator
MTPDHDRAQMLADAEASCRLRGGRLTRGRRLVLDFLLQAARPLTAYEVMDRLRLAGAQATPASAYRSLEFLLEHGLAHRLETTRAYVACGHPDHPHAGQFLICRQCGTVVETEDERVAEAAEQLGHRLGFAVDQRMVELTGVCGPCQG